jgi:hypothetical protein
VSIVWIVHCENFLLTHYPCSGIVASIIRTTGFFHDNKIFADPRWETVDLFAYSIAEPGSYFLAACFSSYKVLGNYIKREKIHTLLVRCRLVSQRHASQSFVQMGSPDDIEYKAGSGDKPVRGFDSVMLSEIERDSTTQNSRDSI